MMTIMTVFLVPVSAYLLVPVFYKLKLTSVYEVSYFLKIGKTAGIKDWSLKDEFTNNTLV